MSKAVKTETVDACYKVHGDCWACSYADLCDRWNDVGTQAAQVEVIVKE